MSELIDKTKSICPVCFSVIDADIVEDKGKVLIKKSCPSMAIFRIFIGQIIKCLKMLKNSMSMGRN